MLLTLHPRCVAASASSRCVRNLCGIVEPKGDFYRSVVSVSSAGLPNRDMTANVLSSPLYCSFPSAVLYLALFNLYINPLAALSRVALRRLVVSHDLHCMLSRHSVNRRNTGNTRTWDTPQTSQQPPNPFPLLPCHLLPLCLSLTLSWPLDHACFLRLGYRE